MNDQCSFCNFLVLININFLFWNSQAVIFKMYVPIYLKLTFLQVIYYIIIESF